MSGILAREKIVLLREHAPPRDRGGGLKFPSITLALCDRRYMFAV